MDASHHQLGQSLGQYVNRWLKIGFIFMSLVSIVLAYALYQTIKHKMVTLVPPVLSHQMSISLIEPDDSYLAQMALFLLGMKLNVSPDNVLLNHRVLKSHTSPKTWGQLNSVLEKEAKDIQEGRISSVFYPSEQEMSIERLQVKVKGMLEKRVGLRLVSHQEVRFIVQFDYYNGSLHVKDIVELKKP
ncbi:type IV conjugative transfer system protein TraE [Cysteiniphilum halobium]|uniref:type IV conjugative transfer system protein TraE n=1 Tax=Cysteiniphilum halobium TaxID=2219059 RepID=UPI000E64D3B3|nr:type IV conjugative transfer system protein TraE [Cysteiniphilum halobium]